mgnify:CR=1 FL=1|tara:strand:+ start:162 stop:386 length:225 start_codon:yes stop_codon:yes gene_type:complete
MNDAPDTIWAYVAQRPRVGIWRHDNDGAVTVEYTRADLANKAAVTLIEQNAELIKRINHLERVLERQLEDEAPL